MGEAEASLSGTGVGGSASGSNARLLLTVGASPPTETTLDGAYSRHQRRPSGLQRARALLELGPSSAVENCEALYEIGLPHGLPGGLSTLAIHKREALVEKTNAVRALQQASARVRAAGKAAQGKLRNAGEYDKPRDKPRHSSEAGSSAEPHACEVGAGGDCGGTGSGSDDEEEELEDDEPTIIPDDEPGAYPHTRSASESTRLTRPLAHHLLAPLGPCS